MVKGIEGHESEPHRSQVKFGWIRMKVRMEDSLENQGEKWRDEGKKSMQHNSMFLWMGLFFFVCFCLFLFVF